jgi:tetratricopeptide (TPR) repeat protein
MEVTQMSDEEVKQLIEAATKESLRESFTEAGKKYLKAAEKAEGKGNTEEADNLYRKAADAFHTAADKFRASKSYKNAALNMCSAGDVFSDMAMAQQAVDAYTTAAEDLFNASGEYIMWGEESEVRKGTALAMAACMMYIMIGKEADGFYKARTYAAENASKLKFPAVIRLSQIPQMLESAIQSVDITAFAEAENATVTELKAALASSGANEFIPYVDKGLNMVREILRGRLKSPKISAQLDLPVDVVFNEEFPIKLHVQNTGDGDALNLTVEWVLESGISVVNGEKSRKFPTVPPGQSVSLEISAISKGEDQKSVEYSIMARGSYNDKLNTEYSLQAGPGSLIVKNFKESTKLTQAIDVTQGRVGILTASILDSTLEKEPLEKIASVLSKTLDSARVQIEQSELEAAKAMIKTTNDLVDEIDSLLGDESLIESIQQRRETEKNQAIQEKIRDIKERLVKAIESQELQLKSETEKTDQDWEISKKRMQDASQTISKISTAINALTSQISTIHGLVPTASTTDNPELASIRTRIRTSLNDALDRLKTIEEDSRKLSESQVLKVGEKPDIMIELNKALQALNAIMHVFEE